MQDSPLLGDVDLLAPEHGVDPFPEAGFSRQPQEERQGLVGDPMLRVVEVDAHCLGRHPLTALGVVREQLPEVQPAYLADVCLEGLPGRTRGEWRDTARHVPVPFDFFR